MTQRPTPRLPEELLGILRCPVTGLPLRQDGSGLVTASAGPGGEPVHYSIEDGIAILIPGSSGEQPEAGSGS
ncbi:hypothetical protein [Psychromicrobium xiongbiense]|uniref:hypothetical protein n=1 Tax=Psychromicrobium xiongbiense TaxID=3051184 RepID=UPI00255313B2|nr:hypothetical protein [Psychromicrobium sp. YIM S02556]